MPTVTWTMDAPEAWLDELLEPDLEALALAEACLLPTLVWLAAEDAE